MELTAKPPREKGADGFERYYQRLFGDRWQALRTALLRGEAAERPKVVRENAFADPIERSAFFEAFVPGPLAGTFEFERGQVVESRDASGRPFGYVMDPASIVAARSLPLTGAREVLDLCAAPGGKSLILAEGLKADARLTLNDRSPNRRRRLDAVLRDYLPDELRARVSLWGYDGRRVGLFKKEFFDAILLDAPCSSESHVLRDEGALSDWSSTRSERLAKDQYALLTSALGALKPGGSLLYSTCALCPQENDGVIDRLLSRGRHSAEVAALGAELGEPTTHGRLVLPDTTGYGPLYFSLLRRPE